MCNARQYAQVHLQCLLKQTICITVSAPPQVCIHPLNHHQSQPSPSNPAPPQCEYSSRAPPSHAEGFTLPFVQHCSQPSTQSKATSCKNSQSRNICKKVANIGLTSHFVQQIRDLYTFFSQLLPSFEPRCHFFSATPPDLCHLSFFSTPPSPLPILCLLYLLKCSHTTHCGICWHTCAPSAKHEEGRQQRSPRADTSASCVALGCTMLYCGVLCFTEVCAMC